jgi:hypothetical protein
VALPPPNNNMAFNVLMDSIISKMQVLSLTRRIIPAVVEPVAIVQEQQQPPPVHGQVAQLPSSSQKRSAEVLEDAKNLPADVEPKEAENLRADVEPEEEPLEEVVQPVAAVQEQQQPPPPVLVAAELQAPPVALAALPQAPPVAMAALPQAPPAALVAEQQPPAKRRRLSGAAPTRRSVRLQAQGQRRAAPQVPAAVAPVPAPPVLLPVVLPAVAPAVQQPAHGEAEGVVQLPNVAPLVVLPAVAPAVQAPVAPAVQAEVVDQQVRRKGAKKLGPPSLRSDLRRKAAEEGWQAFLTPLPTDEVEDEVEQRPRSTRKAAKVCKAKVRYMAYALRPNLCTA